MTIILYQNLSEANVVDKKLVKLSTMRGVLRQGTSIISPSIRIASNVSIQNVNYIYIEEFSRYYFVGDIASVRNGVWDFACHVDVLGTYKTQLKQLKAIIARQEFSYNLYLEDDRLLSTCRRIYTTLAFPNRVQSARDNPDAPSFILTCAGGADDEESEET